MLGAMRELPQREMLGIRKAIADWAARQEDIRAIGLAGSWARGTAREDSDLDLVLLTDAPGRYIDRSDWIRGIGGEALVRTRSWGVLTERRVRMASGLELDVGVVTPAWAAIDPVDAGTPAVATDELVALYDPDGILARLIEVTSLRLRPFRISDEDEALKAQEELATENFPFLLDLHPDEPWARYLERLANKRRGLELPERWVPSTFLAADVGAVLVGRVSIRHELNEFLENFGRHIGYAVRPDYRRRGFATGILRQALNVARAEGIEAVLMPCDEDNLAAATIIKRLGGELEDFVSSRVASPNAATGSTHAGNRSPNRPCGSWSRLAFRLLKASYEAFEHRSRD